MFQASVARRCKTQHRDGRRANHESLKQIQMQAEVMGHGRLENVSVRHDQNSIIWMRSAQAFQRTNDARLRLQQTLAIRKAAVSRARSSGLL